MPSVNADHHLQDVGDLGGRVERHLAAERLRHRQHGPCFHRHRDQTLLDVALADRVGGGGERLVDGTLVVLDQQVPRVAGVGAELVVDHDPVGQRVLEVDHGFERLVLHVDRFERVASGGLAVGEHARHAVSRVARLRRGERVVRRVLHVVGDRPRARHRSAPLIGQVGSGVRRPDAGHGQRARDVDGGDAGVGVRAAQHGEVQGAGDLDVVRELGFAGEERRVFAPQQPLADHSGPFLRGRHLGAPSRSVDRSVTCRRRRAPTARCCGIPCSGTGCLRDRCARRARSGAGSPSTGWSPPSPCPGCSSRIGGRGSP